MIDLLWCDGTWSTPTAHSEVSEALRKRLAGTDVRFIYVPYPAAFGPATGADDLAPAESISAGMVALRDAVRATPHPAMVGGYSQGAMVAVAYAREILPGERVADVRAVATAGDPHQLVHVGRAGIAGPLSVPRQRISVYVPGDPIADLPLGSPLRSIADLTEWMSVRSPQAAGAWVAHAFDALVRQRAQAWWAPWRWADISRAIDDVRGYYPGTAHTTDYITGGHVDRLAARILAAAS